MKTDLLSIILSMVLSGVVATCITIIYQKIEQVYNTKRTVFLTAVSYRYQVAEEDNVKALNSIDVVFYRDTNVRRAWKEYLDAANKPNNGENINDKYIRLLEEMAKACGYNKIKWDDLKRLYYPVGLSDKKLEAETLRKLQIKAAEMSVAGNSGDQKNTPQKQQITNQQVLEILPQLLAHPESLGKLIELANLPKSK